MGADDRTRIQTERTSAGVGTQLSGIYELDARLASGGMGEVYRGHNIQTGDLVAIKIVLPEFAGDETILKLFRKEASVLNHLSHEAVVRYHVFTVDPGIGRPYLAMEYVDGESLVEVMRHGPMPVESVRRLCHRLASGLAAVHRAGAIHRDLSPDNIILPGGNVEKAKIIDFGIARSAKIGGGTLIGGRFAGKYNYVSPGTARPLRRRGERTVRHLQSRPRPCRSVAGKAARHERIARSTRSRSAGGYPTCRRSPENCGRCCPTCCSPTRPTGREAWPKSQGGHAQVRGARRRTRPSGRMKQSPQGRRRPGWRSMRAGRLPGRRRT